MKTIALFSTLALSLASAALSKSAIAAPEDFIVRQYNISDVRELSEYDFGKYEVSDRQIVRGIQAVCTAYQRGLTRQDVSKIRKQNLDTLEPDLRYQTRDLLITLESVAVVSVCPQYRDR